MFHYIFIFSDGRRLDFSVDPARAYQAGVIPENAPGWSQLDSYRCPDCPLAGKCSHCPAAVDLIPVVSAFSDITSIEQVTVTVIGPERTYVKECDVQTALNSLIGLIMASSACPVYGRFRTLAQSHLPFASYDESLFRVIGHYLIQQYFLFRKGEDADLELGQLDAFFRTVGECNAAFVERVREASDRDAGANALTMYWGRSLLTSSSLESQLEAERIKWAPDL